jgi:predicted nucleic acid-binding protein
MSTTGPEKAPPPPKVYIDTMAFVYKLVNMKHRLFPKANAFFSDIEQAKYAGVISTFEIAEFQSAVKSLLSEAMDAEVSQNDVEKEMSRLNEFLNEMGIMLYDADVVLDSRPLVAFYRGEQLIGAARPIKGVWDQKWHTIGGADALHLTIAEAVGAESFATFDQGFKGVSGTHVRMLILSEEY